MCWEKKLTTSALTALLFLLLLFPIAQSVLVHTRKTCTSSSTVVNYSGGDDYTLENITQQDGAYHKATNLSIEWWYFDAVFSNNYSIQIGFMIISKDNKGVLLPGVNVYKNGKNLIHMRKPLPFSFFKASQQYPILSVKDIFSLRGTINETTGIGTYVVDFSMGNVTAHLLFSGTMRGWKTENWAIILPRATVEGTLTIEQKSFNVTGEGYHEHKWELSPLYVAQFKGYYWGKLTTDHANIIWINQVDNFNHNKSLIVLNYGKNIVKKIDPGCMHLTITNYTYHNEERVPDAFALSIVSNYLELNVTMKALGIHNVHVFISQYWRYHVKTAGTLHLPVFDAHETINNVQIMDRMAFR